MSGRPPAPARTRPERTGAAPRGDDLPGDDVRAPAAAGPLLTGLLVALVGAPQVWDALRSRDFGPELVFYPVLVLALGHIALRRSRG